MPEATINEYRNTRAAEDDISTPPASGNDRLVDPEP